MPAPDPAEDEKQEDEKVNAMPRYGEFGGNAFIASLADFQGRISSATSDGHFFLLVIACSLWDAMRAMNADPAHRCDRFGCPSISARQPCSCSRYVWFVAVHHKVVSWECLSRISTAEHPVESTVDQIN